jgi:hypothetical protein
MSIPINILNTVSVEIVKQVGQGNAECCALTGLFRVFRWSMTRAVGPGCVAMRLQRFEF